MGEEVVAWRKGGERTRAPATLRSVSTEPGVYCNVYCNMSPREVGCSIDVTSTTSTAPDPALPATSPGSTSARRRSRPGPAPRRWARRARRAAAGPHRPTVSLLLQAVQDLSYTSCCRSPTSSTSSEKHTPHLRPPGGAHVHFPRHPPPSTIHLTPRYHSLRAIHLPHSARSTSLRAIHLTGSTSATRTRSSQPDAACSRARLGATGYDVDTACARRRAGPWASSTLALRRLPAFIVGAPHAPPPGR